MSDLPENAQHETDSEPQAPIVNPAGTAKFKTIKAGCGIRFDPDTLCEDAGFDFSEAEKLRQSLTDEADSPPDNPET
jgi:hypothetical protein